MMEFPILIEQAAGDGYVARAASGRAAAGHSPEEALARLRGETDAAAKRAAMAIPVPAGSDPLQKWAGTLPDDELTAEWWNAVQAYRDEVESDPNRP